MKPMFWLTCSYPADYYEPSSKFAFQILPKENPPLSTKMVMYPGLADDVVARIRELGVYAVVAESDDAALREIRDADCFYGRMSPALLENAGRLRWIQATSAGLDNYFFPELRRSDVTLTNLRGIYSDVIADHVFAFILMFARGMHVYHARKLNGIWEKGADVIHLGGKTLGIIGLGGIGLEVAKRGHAFGMRVIGVDPAPKDRPDYVEEIYGPEDLRVMLVESDFVIVCVPHTGETEYMLGDDGQRAMKPGSILVNIGRGKVVDLAALARHIESGHIGGAALDVYEEEPLPSEHPLWAMEQVLLTPHVAGVSPVVQGRREDVIVENVSRFIRDEPLINVVDKEKGYVVAVNPT
jgi:phosphoglycerate dehydrogenase-like enzyme